MFAQLEIVTTDEFDVLLTDEDGETYASISAVTQRGLDLWNEESRDFSYERDAERLAQLLGWQLDNDERVFEYSMTALAEQLRIVAEPGACQGGPDRHFIDIELS